MGTTGCVSFMFDKKGQILVELTEGMDEEELMMQALEAGAEDFSTDVDTCEIISAPENFSQVRQTLEQISGELARQDEGLDKLTKSCCAELTHRAPDPLPLDEK